MDLSFLWRGIVIGFSIAAPVGPIGALCIRRTLAEGRALGLISGLGAATADAIYGLVAGFGLTFVSTFLLRYQLGVRLVGGAFLCYLGLRAFLARPAQATTDKKPGFGRKPGFLAAYASTLLLTLTNPMTILSFAAIFAGAGLVGGEGSYASAALLVLGVFLGSAAWWLLLSGGVSLLRTRLDAALLRWVNRVAGLVILAFGVRFLWLAIR